MTRRLHLVLACLLAACGFDRSGVAMDDDVVADAAPTDDFDGGSLVVPPDAPACGSDPVPPGADACPAECTGGCVDGVCTIDCTGNGACRNSTLVCPPGHACEVRCDGDVACENAIVACPETYACAVTCTGRRSCRRAEVACGAGSCSMTCGSGDEVCTGATELACGDGACAARCTGGDLFGGGGGEPSVICGSACSCDPC